MPVSTGQSGIVVHDAWEIEGHVCRVATSTKHIKMADTFVYSQYGDLLPLSCRFDKSSSDIRGSLVAKSPSLPSPMSLCAGLAREGSLIAR